MKLKDLTGKRFGKLVVVSRAPSKKRSTQWNCKCDCGIEKSIAACHLVSGCIKDCGRVHYELGENHHSWKGCGEIGHRYFQHVRNGAKLRRLKFSISLSQMWKLVIKQDGRCALSGVHLTFKRSNGRMVGTASLDRKDSAKGYIKGNVQWIHKDINFMKRNLPEETFLTHCRNISRHSQ